jgi:hypothetical protein
MSIARRVPRYVDTIWAIAASRWVQQYVVGITCRQAWQRRLEYHAQGYDHLVILADKLTLKEAHWLEERLQAEIRLNRRHTNYRKYHEDKRMTRYYRSAGSGSPNPNARIHSVYMAWWEPR